MTPDHHHPGRLDSPPAEYTRRTFPDLSRIASGLLLKAGEAFSKRDQDSLATFVAAETGALDRDDLVRLVHAVAWTGGVVAHQPPEKATAVLTTLREAQEGTR